jgi:hypothetical protein
VKKDIVTGSAIPLRVKGKQQELIVHQVIGYKDRSGRLHTVLSEEEQSQILESRSVTNEIPEQTPTPELGPENTKWAATTVSVSSNSTKDPAPPRFMASELDKADHTVAVSEKLPPRGEWYLVLSEEAKDPEGPFTMDELRAKTSQPGFPFQKAHIYKEGDPEMTPVREVGELSKRKAGPAPAIQAPLPSEDLRTEATADEWYISSGDEKTYGPYNIEQLQDALSSGHITRTTYAWRQGMEAWIYVYEIPGFDRRHSAA